MHSPTPLSDKAIQEEWPQFVAECAKRLERGKREYGDESFTKSPRLLTAEIEQELLDYANWSFICWSRVRKLRNELEAALRR